MIHSHLFLSSMACSNQLYYQMSVEVYILFLRCHATPKIAVSSTCVAIVTFSFCDIYQEYDWFQHATSWYTCVNIFYCRKCFVVFDIEYSTSRILNLNILFWLHFIQFVNQSFMQDQKNIAEPICFSSYVFLLVCYAVSLVNCCMLVSKPK